MTKSATRKGLIVGIVAACMAATLAMGCASNSTAADQVDQQEVTAYEEATDNTADIDAKEASHTKLTDEELAQVEGATIDETEIEATEDSEATATDEADDDTLQTDAEASAYEELYPIHAAAADDPHESLAGFHIALGYSCETCHKDSLAEQVEATGADGEPELSSLYYTDTETCLTSGCHDSWEDLAESTADLGEYNPHASIHGTIEYCNECHKAHSPQVDICAECHPNGGQEMLF